MKCLLILAEGLPDSPYRRFDNKTPLQLARTPNLDKLAYKGRSGTSKLVPPSCFPGSDTGFISLMGNNPANVKNGRGYFEALGIGIDIGDDKTAFRVNLVSVQNDELISYGTASIVNDEGRAIVDSLNDNFKELPLQFFHVSNYRMVLVIKNEWLFEGKKENLKTVRPLIGKKFHLKSHLPKGNGSEKIIDLMEEAKSILIHHDINQVKIDLGEDPANEIWIWGNERTKKLKPFSKVFNFNGYCVPGSQLIKGIAMDLGMSTSDVIEPHGDGHSSLPQRVEYTKKAFEANDFVLIHIETINDISLQGDIYKKCQSIENFDDKIVGELAGFLEENYEEYRILVTSTHALKLNSMAPVKVAVPWVLFGHGVKSDKGVLWSEKDCDAMSFTSIAGNNLLKKTLFKK